MRYATTDDGIRYTIEHDRTVEVVPKPATTSWGTGVTINETRLAPKGGTTTVKILGADDAVVAIGVATCNPDLDNFNLKLGHRIALGRALAELSGEAEARRQRAMDREAEYTQNALGGRVH